VPHRATGRVCLIPRDPVPLAEFRLVSCPTEGTRGPTWGAFSATQS
jgi:hypothetical protein